MNGKRQSGVSQRTVNIPDGNSNKNVRLNVVAPTGLVPGTHGHALAKALGIAGELGTSLINNKMSKDYAKGAITGGNDQPLPEGVNKSFEDGYLSARGLANVDNASEKIKQDVNQALSDHPLTADEANQLVDNEFQKLLTNDKGQIDLTQFGNRQGQKAVLQAMAKHRATINDYVTKRVHKETLQNLAGAQADRMNSSYINDGKLNFQNLVNDASTTEARQTVRDSLIPEGISIAVSNGDPKALTEMLDARFKDGTRVITSQQRVHVQNAIIQAANVRNKLNKEAAKKASEDAQVGFLDSLLKGDNITSQVHDAANSHQITGEKAKTWLRFQDFVQNDTEQGHVNSDEWLRLRSEIATSDKPVGELTSDVLASREAGVLGSGQHGNTATQQLLQQIHDIRQERVHGTRIQDTPEAQSYSSRLKSEMDISKSPFSSFTGADREARAIRGDALNYYALTLSHLAKTEAGKSHEQIALDAYLKTVDKFKPKFDNISSDYKFHASVSTPNEALAVASDPNASTEMLKAAKEILMNQ